jgi:small-conductance mechanosensitive channel
MTSVRRVAGLAALAVLLMFGAVAVARGQEPVAEIQPAAAQAAEPAATAVLKVLNRPIVVFRGPLLGIPPAERADAAEQRIMAQLDRGGPGVVSTAQVGDNVVVHLDGRLAFVVAPADANPLLEETVADVARGAAAALEQVVRESQESRDTRARWRALGLGLLYLAAWVVAVALLARLRRLAARRFSEFAELHATRLRVGGTSVVSRGHAGRIAARILGGLYGLVVLLAAYETLGLILREFPYTRPWGEGLDGFLVRLLKDLLAGIAGAAPGLAVVVVIVVLTRFVSGAGKVFFDRVRQKRIVVDWLDADLTAPTQRLFNVVIWLFALAMAYPYLPGSGSAAFDGLSVLVGLMVSLGGASAVGQAISGLILMYSRTYRVGDYVRIDDIEGTVVALTSLQTRLRSGMGDEIVLANSRVVAAKVRNYSRPAKGAGIVVDASVTIGYDAPWRQVHALLTQAARATPGIVDTPAPTVFQTALSDFYVEYRLVCQSDTEGPRPRAEVMSELHANIQDAFNAAGVQIMSPHYFADPAAPKVVPRDQWDPGKP